MAQRVAKESFCSCTCETKSGILGEQSARGSPFAPGKSCEAGEEISKELEAMEMASLASFLPN